MIRIKIKLFKFFATALAIVSAIGASEDLAKYRQDCNSGNKLDYETIKKLYQ